MVSEAAGGVPAIGDSAGGGLSGKGDAEWSDAGDYEDCGDTIWRGINPGRDWRI